MDVHHIATIIQSTGELNRHAGGKGKVRGNVGRPRRSIFMFSLVRSERISAKNYEWLKTRASILARSCSPLVALSPADRCWCIWPIRSHQSRTRLHETQTWARLFRLSLNLPNHTVSKGSLVGNWFHPLRISGFLNRRGLAPEFQLQPEQRV